LKKIAVRCSPDPAKIGFSPDTVLISAHLCLWCVLRWPSKRSPHLQLIVLHRPVTLRSMD